MEHFPNNLKRVMGGEGKCKNEMWVLLVCCCWGNVEVESFLLVHVANGNASPGSIFFHFLFLFPGGEKSFQAGERSVRSFSPPTCRSTTVGSEYQASNGIGSEVMAAKRQKRNGNHQHRYQKKLAYYLKRSTCTFPVDLFYVHSCNI